MCRNGGCCGHTSHADVRLPAAVGMAVGVASSAAAAALAHDVLAAVAWVLYGVVIPAMSVWVVVLIRRGRTAIFRPAPRNLNKVPASAGQLALPAPPLAIEAPEPVPLTVVTTPARVVTTREKGARK